MAPYTHSVKKSTMLCPPQMNLKHVAPSTTLEKAICVQPSLIKLNQEKSATSLKTDNYTTEVFVNLGMKPNIQKHGI